MNPAMRRLLFLLFFLSGFCSLVYQVVWTRLAFAAFGIITPVLSVVLSVFMLGLAAGSWAGGRWIGRWVEKTGISAIAFYAAAELTIGLSAFAVPQLFATGEKILLAAGQANSGGYLFLSALMLAVSLLPWCVCMGATFPLVMAYVRERNKTERESFSFLYLANVLGAMSGALFSAVVLVELLGFQHTLWFAAAGNFVIALAAGRLAWEQRGQTASPPPAEVKPATDAPVSASAAAGRMRLIPWILFSTGFCAMAMEVVWTRAFTPVLKTQVYSFAMIVFTYLGATFVGSWWYRRRLWSGLRCPTAQLLALLAAVVLLPVLVNDARFVRMDPVFILHPGSVILLLASICPLCGVLGGLTPGLVDEYAGGHPAAAGRAYALNVLGCILGPLFASYVLLPRMSERFALILLALPFLGFCLPAWKSLSARWRWGSGAAAGAALAAALFFTRDLEWLVSNYSDRTEVRRDYAATVISTGEGMERSLLVNGIGMTKLTPITKFMVHLPLAYHDGPPRSALIICFGMGTTYRSALSWDIDTTAVELVPSVPKAFGFYHADAAQCLANPRGRIVVDDGRRFLMRTREKFDVIVIDPPPPVESAGSSLLYSKEFYALAKQHLKPHGVIQAWFPGGEVLTAQAILRSFRESFPYVRCFDSVQGWGSHLIGSLEPIEPLTAAQLAARMPPAAQRDLMEWSNTGNLPDYLNEVLNREMPMDKVLNPDPNICVTDDRPFNEYFLLRDNGL